MVTESLQVTFLWRQIINMTTDFLLLKNYKPMREGEGLRLSMENISSRDLCLSELHRACHASFAIQADE
jgi:hypothetical protein